MRKAKVIVLGVVCTVLLSLSSLLAYDLAGGVHCGYVVAVAHLDTQWQWTRTDTYNTFIPNTLHQNFTLFRTYPRYKFSFCGAFRYWIAEQFGSGTAHSGTGFQNYDWDTLKKYIASGQWALAGSWIDETDPNMPCLEAMCRNYLYGQGYYLDKFNKRSYDIYLPDCFGFSYNMPTIARHFGVVGFSSQKFDNWGGYFTLSNAQSIMKWTGPDGSYIFAANRCSGYGSAPEVNTAAGDAVYAQNGNRLWMTYDYYGTGDQGGAPTAGNVAAACAATLNGANLIPAASDSLFKTLDSLDKQGNAGVAAMANWNGELVMQTHGTGCYSSRSDIKSRYRNMELGGLSCEPAAVMANKVAGAVYPKAAIWRAWFKGIDHAFHDDLTGTSIVQAYTNNWDGTLPDLDSQVVNFNTVRTNANTAMAGVLNTQVAAGVPVVVYNPIGQDRRDIAQVSISGLVSAATYVKVLDPFGIEVPSQIISGAGTTAPTILFVAAVPAAGYAVYNVQPATSYTGPATGVSVDGTAWTMTNDYYTVSIDATGDISQIVDRKNGNRNLLASANRLQTRPDNSNNWPDWEVLRADVQATPTNVTGGTRTVVESGPVRVTVQVTRSQSNSNYTHLYRLVADSSGKRIVTDNTIAWNQNATMLKAGFFFAASNPNATYSVGIGTINRPNYNVDNRYEVPAQNWAAIDNSDGTFGTAVIQIFKYGWSKPANNTLNSTLIHSPSGTGYGNTDHDLRTHTISYAIYGYVGNWRNGVENQSQLFQLPLVTLQTSAHAATVPLPNSSKTYSFVRLSDPTTCQIVAVKKAERGDTTGSDKYIVRVRNISGAAATATLVFGNQIIAAPLSTNGMEEEAGATTLSISGPALNQTSFSIGSYQLRTIKVKLGTVTPPSVYGRDGSIPSYDDMAFKVMLRAGSRQNMVKFLFNAADKVRRVYVVNLAGCLVRTLHGGTAPLSPSALIAWDGRDTRGGIVPNGAYVINVVTDRVQKHALVQIIK